MADGGAPGVRAPMHESEEPVVRPYPLVDDIDAAVVAAFEAGDEMALPPTELPGHGKCAIVESSRELEYRKVNSLTRMEVAHTRRPPVHLH